MARNWTMDEALVQAISQNIYEALPLLPKRFIRVDSLTKELGMPFSHIQILCMLAKGEMSFGKISVNLGIAKPNITPLIDRMINAGYVTRERNAADRRVVHVVILDKGREKVRDTVEALRVCMDAWAKELDAGKLETLSDALETIRQLLGNE